MPDGSLPTFADVHVPPHNSSSERAILAAILLSPSAPLPALRPEHFYFDCHARIFEAMQSVGGDIVAVALELKRTGRLRQVGEQRELARLVMEDDSPVSDLAAHVEIVVEAWRNRRLIRVLQTVSAEMYGGLSADDAWRRVREECAA